MSIVLLLVYTSREYGRDPASDVGNMGYSCGCGGTPVLALVVAIAAAATALAADRLGPPGSPAAARLSAVPAARAARLAERTGIAAPYWSVDPRTAKPVRLGQPLTTGAPIFPGDPPFRWRVWTTVPESGYLLE